MFFCTVNNVGCKRGHFKNISKNLFIKYYVLIFDSCHILFSVSGHYIGEIDKGSPAERAGLKNMDRLVAVNGQEIDNCRHEQVVEKISQQGNKCSLLVLDAETEKMYKLVSPFHPLRLI